MVNKKLKEKIIDGVTFQLWSITGTEIYIGSYFFKCKFDIDNEAELKAIAIALKTFLEHLENNDYLKDTDDKIMSQCDKQKVNMMNNLLDFIKDVKDCLGENIW